MKHFEVVFTNKDEETSITINNFSILNFSCFDRGTFDEILEWGVFLNNGNGKAIINRSDITFFYKAIFNSNLLTADISILYGEKRKKLAHFNAVDVKINRETKEIEFSLEDVLTPLQEQLAYKIDIVEKSKLYNLLYSLSIKYETFSLSTLYETYEQTSSIEIYNSDRDLMKIYTVITELVAAGLLRGFSDEEGKLAVSNDFDFWEEDISENYLIKIPPKYIINLEDESIAKLGNYRISVRMFDTSGKEDNFDYIYDATKPVEKEITTNQFMQLNNRFNAPNDTGNIEGWDFVKYFSYAVSKYKQGISCAIIETLIIENEGEILKRGDIICPYVFQNNFIQPYKTKNSYPMTFRVIGIEYLYDGLPRQKIHIQEYGTTKNDTRFWVDEIECGLTDGMTWRQWLRSNYNTVGFYEYENLIFVDDNRIIEGAFLEDKVSKDRPYPTDTYTNYKLRKLNWYILMNINKKERKQNYEREKGNG